MLEGLEIIQEFGQQRQRKFGRVFLCQQLESTQKVIVKQVLKTAKNKRAIEQIHNERTFNFTLNELPQIIDFKEDENYLFLIKKHIEGITLKEYWSKLKKSERIVFLKEFFASIVPLFNFLNAENIVHNDIKPSNFIVNNVNGKLVVSLIDFGLAIRKNEKSTRKTLFPLGFASPELLLNQLDIVDQRSDIFALGITIFNLVTNRLPFYHSNPSIYTNLQITHPLPGAREIQQDLFEVIQKCCVKHSFKTAPNLMQKELVQNHLQEAINLRYQTIEELQLAINELKEFESISQRLKRIFS